MLDIGSFLAGIGFTVFYVGIVGYAALIWFLRKSDDR
jgi:hypothetical protein